MQEPNDDMSRDELKTLWYTLKDKYDDLREMYLELKEHTRWMENRDE